MRIILLLHEAHLAVDLRELRLAVGPEVLVAEAADNLEIAVVAGHHQQLLEGLGRLGQRVEGSRVHARGHHEVARPFRGGLYQIGGLNLHETLAVKVVAHLVGEAVPQGEGALERRTAKVEVAVFRTQVLTAVADFLDRERRGHGLVEHIDAFEPYLDVAGGHLGVLAGPFDNLSDSLDYIFASEAAGGLDKRMVSVGLDHKLGA